jgi:4-amino-4-deoxy-L-arabinose transferase-like glycosyltransferase
MQQGHVGLFPASDPRTVLMPPFSEYAGLHLMILSGGDRWANLVQWFALALTAVTASAIARELGCNGRLQALAALLAVTIPTAALQAANPKNDVVTAFFLCAFAFAGLKAYNSRQFSAPLIGSACGLLILSKGTGLIYGLPVAVWIGAMWIRAHGLKRALPWGVAVALIAFIINAPFVGRITSTFGSPLGPPVGEGAPPVANTLFTPRAFASNLLRNTAMHLATGVRRIDGASTRAVAGLHGALGIDTNDPRTTFMKGAPFEVTADFFDEDRAKAPVHMALAIIAFAVIVGGLLRGEDKRIASFLLLPFLCFGLFCYLMAWQEWHSRLHIPLFCLAAAVIVRTLQPIARACGPLALALALMCVINSEAKPLLQPRKARHRFKTSETLKGLAEASRTIRERRPRVLGIVSQPNRCEYFLLSALINAAPTTPRFVKVNNRFPQITSPHTNFDLVISWHNPIALTNADFQATYRLISEVGVVAVFDRK